MADRFKTAVQILGIAASAAALLLGLLMLASGYWWQAAAIGITALAGLVFAAWYGRSRPVPLAPREWVLWDVPLPPQLSPTEEQMLRFGLVSDPVDVHQAQMARALHGSRFGMACYADTEPTYVWFPDSKTLGR